MEDEFNVGDAPNYLYHFEAEELVNIQATLILLSNCASEHLQAEAAFICIIASLHYVLVLSSVRPTSTGNFSK